MIKIKALNESVTSSDEEVTNSQGPVTREAREEALYQLYNQSLKYLKDGETSSAKQLLLKLNEHLNNSAVAKVTLFNQLRFLTLKNLGMICKNDLNYWLDALEIDATDFSLWIKTGDRAAELGNYQLSRSCYEEAHSLSQSNWIAIDRLIDSYFILHDLYSCFKLCCKALDFDNGYEKAIILLKEINYLHPPMFKEFEERHKIYLKEGVESNEEVLSK